MSDSLQILSIALVDEEGMSVSAPVASVWYNVDAGWCLLPALPAQTVSVSLFCAGAMFDALYSDPSLSHTLSTGGRTSIDAGWSPDDVPVYLSPWDAALGFWRVQFPAAGTFTFVLTDNSDASEIGEAAFVVAAAPPSPTLPHVEVLKVNPLNRQISMLIRLSFSGTYPNGGLDLPGTYIGRESYLFADINVAPPYQFSWEAGKLKVYDALGELAADASVTFSTTAIFIGP